MGLLTDDCDLNETYLSTFVCGNGDYYIQLKFKDKQDGLYKTACTRISTSGGNAPTEVKLAVANLHRALEKENLNQ